MRTTRRAALAGLIIALVSASAVAQGLVSFERSTLEVIGPSGRRHGFAVEVAQSARQLSQGLMYRKSLAKDAGMLFDFGAVQPIAMWMKNTLIPLDMVFIAADGRVTGVAERTVPMSTTVISSPGPVRAVLELNGGTAARLDIKAGDRVVHPIFAQR